MTAFAVVLGLVCAIWLVVRTIEVRELRKALVELQAATATAREQATAVEAIRASLRDTSDRTADIDRRIGRAEGQLRELTRR